SALRDPILDSARGVLRAGEFVHLSSECAMALQIRSGDVHLRAGHSAGIDRTLYVQIGVRLETAGGARGCHSAGKVKTRKAERLFVVDRDAAAGWIKEMLVHSHETRNHRVAGKIERAGAFRSACRSCRPHRGDLAVVNDDSLVLRW